MDTLYLVNENIEVNYVLLFLKCEVQAVLVQSRVKDKPRNLLEYGKECFVIYDQVVPIIDCYLR